MKIIEIERKGRILTRAQFGCLRDVYTLNITKGCEFSCAYCYARGYPEAPCTGEVHVYRNLPNKLAEELDNPRRRKAVSWIAFNTSSDSFQSHPTVLETTYQTMTVLLDRGIGFSFLTKGWIPDRFIELFSQYKDFVIPRIGLVSHRPRYRDLFEPYAATIKERLENIERLKGKGLKVEVRIDPVIPFYTDDEDTVRGLCDALSQREVDRASLSYLHMRPAILDQLKRELPSTEFNVLQSCFSNQPWAEVGASGRSKLIPLSLRQKGYRRFMRIFKESGIKTLICSCKNPDMSAQICMAGVETKETQIPSEKGYQQLSLFPC